jgi:hypothetical protein
MYRDVEMDPVDFKVLYGQDSLVCIATIVVFPFT